MKEWCLLHPWMTFLVLIFAIWILLQNIFTLLRGKMNFMENLSIKGGIDMSDNKGNGDSQDNGSSKSSGNGHYGNERGSQHVPPVRSGPPAPPPKQK